MPSRAGIRWRASCEVPHSHHGVRAVEQPEDFEQGGRSRREKSSCASASIDVTERQSAPFIEPLQTKLNAARMIHVEQPGRCPAERRQTDDHSVGEREMLGPNISADWLARKRRAFDWRIEITSTASTKSL